MSLRSWLTGIAVHKAESIAVKRADTPDEAAALAISIVNGGSMDPKTKGAIVGVVSTAVLAAVQAWQTDADPLSPLALKRAAVVGITGAIMTVVAYFTKKPVKPDSLGALAVEAVRKAIEHGALTETHATEIVGTLTDTDAIAAAAKDGSAK